MEVHLRLVSGVRIWVARVGNQHDNRSTLPKMVNPMVGMLSCFIIHLLLPMEPGQQVCLTKHRRLPHPPDRDDQGLGPGRTGRQEVEGWGDKRLRLARLAGEV